jgi:hypothetical protein
MIKYISENQLSIEEFKTPFQAKLNPDNRWVQLSKVVPWDKFASVYMSMMNTGFGRPGISPRIVLGGYFGLCWFFITFGGIYPV